MKTRIGIFFAFTAFLLFPGITLAKEFQTCNLGTHNIDTQTISSVVCDGESEGALSYGANMSYGTGYLALSVMTEKANWGNCTFQDEILNDGIITNVNCPTYSKQNDSSPESWGEYIKSHLFVAIGFLIICMLPYALLILAFGFGFRYGFIFFDTPKNDSKK